MGSGHDLTIMTPGSPRGEPAIRVETFGRLVIVPAGGRTAAGLPPVRSALLVFLAVERDEASEPDRAIALYRGRFLQWAHLGKHREERQVARTAAADTPWLLPSLFWELRALAGMGRFAEIRARVADAHPLPEHGIPCPDRFRLRRCPPV
jgi:hypothetical protein